MYINVYTYSYTYICMHIYICIHILTQIYVSVPYINIFNPRNSSSCVIGTFIGRQHFEGSLNAIQVCVYLSLCTCLQIYICTYISLLTHSHTFEHSPESNSLSLARACSLFLSLVLHEHTYIYYSNAFFKCNLQ